MTPTKQQMITKIYEVIADKTLSFGCLIRHEKVALRGNCIVLGGGYPAKTHVYACYNRSMDDTMSDVGVPKDGLEIIGHLVNIGDVLDWIEKNKNGLRDNGEDDAWIREEIQQIFCRWSNLRQSIDQQSEECIKYVYDLLPTT